MRSIPRRRDRAAGAGAARRDPRRRVLTRDQIVRTALALLDEVGLAGLTMRRLAERLGVQAGALYRHVRDKDELLDLLADAICAEQREPDPALPWREQLRALAGDQLRLLRSRRDAARIIAGTPPDGPERLRLIEATLRTLLAAGFDEADAMQISLMLANYVVGLVLEEEANPAGAAEARGGSGQAVLAEGLAWLRALPADRYPSLVRCAAAVGDPAAFGAEGRFAFGLAVLLAGLEQRLHPNPPGRADG